MKTFISMARINRSVMKGSHKNHLKRVMIEDLEYLLS